VIRTNLPDGRTAHNVRAVKRSAVGRALLVVGMALALAAPSAHAATKKKHVAHKRGKKGHVFLERHVVAMKGGLPNVQALGALVVDETGREIYARNPDKERPIASISKLAATLTIADKGLELDGLSTIEKTDVDVARGGARSRLFDGMTLSNRDLLHAALMGSDNRAIPALGRAVKLSPSQLTAAMNAKVRALGLKNTRFFEPTGLSVNNVSTPRETIKMLRAVMDHPMLGPITQRVEYDAHPVGKPPIRYINTDHAASRGSIQVLAGKTGYNDVARYCLVVATRVEGRLYFMSFLSNEGKLTRFGDVARVADWIISHPQKLPPPLKPAPPVPFAPPPDQEPVAAAPAAPASPAAPPALPVPVVPRSAQEPIASAPSTPAAPLPVDVAAPPSAATAPGAPPSAVATP
jgi:D-alanyl-D-alanine endopeptidase (penicillin-binding protein 7)